MENLEKLKKIASCKEYDLDLSAVNFLGNIIDIGKDNYGIIYLLTKALDDEICVDYYGEEDKISDVFSNVSLFFNLCKIASNSSREELIGEAYNLLDDEGNILLWDYDKNLKEIANLKINVKLPKNKEKSFSYRDFNILNKFTLEDSKKILEKYFFIEEIQVYDKIYFIKGKKKERKQDENIINSSEFKVHSQQLSY